MSAAAHDWRSVPGGWDTTRTRELFALDAPREELWGMPEVRGTLDVPRDLVAWSQLRDRAAADAVHFFEDDHRFERIWSRPERYLERLSRARLVLGPDFSVWRDWPRAVQLWNVYRARWLCAYWEHHGLEVLPTITWAEPSTWAFAFLGVAVGSAVAISTIGIRDERARRLFVDGYAEMVSRIAPSAVVVYGERELPGALAELAPVVRFKDTRIARRRPLIEGAEAEGAPTEEFRASSAQETGRHVAGITTETTR